MLQVGKVKLVVNKRGGNARFLSSSRLSRGGSIKTARQNKSAQKDDDSPSTRLKLNLLQNGWRNVWGPRLLQWINMQTRVNYKSSQTYTTIRVKQPVPPPTKKSNVYRHTQKTISAGRCLYDRRASENKSRPVYQQLQWTWKCSKNKTKEWRQDNNTKKRWTYSSKNSNDDMFRRAFIIYLCVWCWAVYNTVV